MKAFFAAAMIFLASIVGVLHAPSAVQPSQPRSTQAEVLVVAGNPLPDPSAGNSQTISSRTLPPQTDTAATADALISHAITQPSQGQVLGASTGPNTDYVTQEQLASVLSQLQSAVDLQLYGSGSTYAAGGVWNSIAMTNRAISSSNQTGNLSGTSISASNLAGIVPVASGGTGWASIQVGSLLFGGGSSPIATSSNLYWDNSNGRLGIGTSSPLTTLSIGGTAGANDVLNVASSTGASILYVNAAGNVGVDTASPAYALDVNGYINSNTGYNFNGNTVLYANTALRLDAIGAPEAAGWMASSTSPTRSDVAVGLGALAQTPASSAAIYETAVGDSALNAETTGANNTAIGAHALTANTTGGFNNVVGAFALNNNTTGADNTAMGQSAMYSNITGSGNVAVGYFASNYNTSATNTVAIGDHTARGANSSGYNNQGGVYVGALAGLNLTAGSDYNVMLGYSSGRNVSSGSNNILIGAATSSAAISNLTTGSQNILIGNNISFPSATASGQLDIGNILYGVGVVSTGTTTPAGNVAIGTSTPYARLSVWGIDAASSTLAFNVVNNASTTVFAVFDGGNAQLSGTLTQSSDQRLKTNIQSLDASSSLSLIDALNPITFNWIDPSEGTSPQIGFIAQQVQQVFPNLVSTTSATTLTPGGTLGLNYIGLISPIVSAIHALSAEVQSLITEVQGFAQKFTTNQLCVNKSDGTPVCVTGDQLASLLSGQPTVQIGEPNTTISGVSSSTPPAISINGDNPALISVGDSYADLGATVSDTGPGQAGDTNLGYKTFLNGTLVSNIVIDTSQVATDTIDYVATDNDGLTATSTRNVIIGASPSIVPSPDASTSAQATFSSQ